MKKIILTFNMGSKYATFSGFFFRVFTTLMKASDQGDLKLELQIHFNIGHPISVKVSKISILTPEVWC